MKFGRQLIVAVMASSMAVAAQAAVPSEEAKVLGTTHTPWGALKAGNQEGTIPAWAPLKSFPPSFKAASGVYPDPFASEKPLFKIDASNLDKYADKVPELFKAMMKRYPKFYLNVYPGHRIDVMGSDWENGSIRNATRAKLTASGYGLDGAWAGTPFPLPKSGLEVMWNAQYRSIGRAVNYTTDTTMVDASGHSGRLGVWKTYVDSVYADQNLEGKTEGTGTKFFALQTQPARSSGEQNLMYYSLDHDKKADTAWTYLVGQRRVRLAPEFKYDTPAASYGGALTYDEVNGFNGKPDRFDWKLVGTGPQERYAPANAYAVSFGNVGTSSSFVSDIPGMPDTQHWRFELRRVWVIEATRKAGARHSVAKRVYLVDADNWAIINTESYDDAGKLMRGTSSHFATLYDTGGSPFTLTQFIIDFVKGQYVVSDVVNAKVDSRPRKEPLTPEYMGASGVR